MKKRYLSIPEEKQHKMFAAAPFICEAAVNLLLDCNTETICQVYSRKGV